MRKHSVAVGAGISAALFAASAAFGVANGVLRSHPADDISRFDVDHAPTPTSTTIVRVGSETAVVPTGPTPSVHDTVTTTPKRRHEREDDIDHDDD